MHQGNLGNDTRIPTVKSTSFNTKKSEFTAEKSREWDISNGVISLNQNSTLSDPLGMWGPPKLSIETTVDPNWTLGTNAPIQMVGSERKRLTPVTETVDKSLFMDFSVNDLLPSPLYPPHSSSSYRPPAPFDVVDGHISSNNPVGNNKINIIATRSPLVVDKWLFDRQDLLLVKDTIRDKPVQKPSNPWEQNWGMYSGAVKVVEDIDRPFIGFDCEWPPQWDKGGPPNPVATIQIAVRRPQTDKSESDFDVLIISLDNKHAEKIRKGQHVENPITPNLLLLFQSKTTHKLGVGISNDIDYMAAGILQLGLLSQEQYDFLGGDIGNIMHGSIDLGKLVAYDWDRWRKKLGPVEWRALQDRMRRQSHVKKPPKKPQDPGLETNSFGPMSGLAALTTRFLSLPPKPDGTVFTRAVLPKIKKLTLCDWSQWPLSQDQLVYAAMDAVVAIKIFECQCKDMEQTWKTPLDEVIRRGRRSHAKTMILARNSAVELTNINVRDIVRENVSVIVIRKKTQTQIGRLGFW
jgi:hypothetical protein